MNRHDTLLLACGTSQNRTALRSVFEEDFNILEADNSHQTMLLLEQNVECIAAVLIDVSVPEKVNSAAFRSEGSDKLWGRVPAIVITEHSSPDILSLAFGCGALDVIPVDYDPYAMKKRVHNIIGLNLHKIHFEEMVEEQAANLRHTNERLVDALSAIIEYRSAESGQHILRIRRFTQILLEEVSRSCPEYGLDETLINVISSASALHDIGKISIPDAILNKPARLTADERTVIESHCSTGCRILESLTDIGDHEYLRYAHNICHYHHERWDGRGYPEGLSGNDIPICAQVVGLADVYDALTSKRVYKEAFSFDTSVNMILNGECGIFSPKLLECFKHVSKQLEDFAKEYADGLSPNTEYFDASLPAPAASAQNSLDAVQTKYLSLLHYMNTFVAEIDADRRLYHIIYNPYSELSVLCETNSLADAKQLILDQIVIPEELERMQNLLDHGMSTFINAGMRRQTHLFHLRGQLDDLPDMYELTLLRPNPGEREKRTLLMMWRRVEDQSTSPELSSRELNELTEGLFRCVNDAELTLEKYSVVITKLTGYSENELVDLFGNSLIRLILPEDRKLVRQKIDDQLSKGISVEIEYRVKHKNGNVIWLLHKARLVVGSDGTEHLYCLFSDITSSKRSYDKLKDRLDRYEIILSQTENVLFDWDIENDTISFSDTWERIFGFNPVDNNVFDALKNGSYFHPDDISLLFDCIKELRLGASYRMTEVRVATNTGKYLWCRFRASAIRNEDGSLKKLVGVIINIDSEKRASQTLLNRAESDMLTKLLNKQAAQKRIENYLSQYSDEQPSCAMLLIDLDNFKAVNDLHGHMFGDAVLTQAARDIKSLFRAQDIVARVGGDEFLVVMCGVSDRALIEDRCTKLVNIFSNLYRENLEDCHLGCSIGIAVSPQHGTNYYDLFQHADRALYQAKNRGKNNFVFFDNRSFAFKAWRNYVSAVNDRIDSDEQPNLTGGSMLQYAFQKLYTSNDVESSVNDIISIIGKQMNVSRVYIFENTPDNKYCNNTFEWCNEGIEPEIQNLQGICYETDIPDYIDLYNEHGILYCPDINTLPKNIYDIVAPQNIRSMLHCAIRDGGVFRGYIGFDECSTNRLWTKEQIDTLSFFSEMLSIFLLKKRAQEEIAQQANDLRSILDNQNAWIYVIDPDTCRLKFLNSKSRALSSSAKEGAFCYKELMGLDERCPGCPAQDIKNKCTASQNIVNKKFNLDVTAEATLIRWGGEEACLITCRKRNA